ncbi:hypothetical protein [Actinomyces trachealis]|uniref:hypothetical protein n=1 Tax=Actinomyces trachealis TaxID=2763540 RepID=UPI0018C856C1|nr:hypothetical protein [Actinomyces trachealis]
MEAARLPLSGGNGIIVNVVVSVLQVGVGAVLAVRSVTRGAASGPLTGGRLPTLQGMMARS